MLPIHCSCDRIEGVASESVNGGDIRRGRESGVVGVWAGDVADTHRWEESIAEEPKNLCVNFEEH